MSVVQHPSVDPGPAPGSPEAGEAARLARRRAAGDGARDMVPILLGVVPLAVVIGVTIDRSEVDHLAAWAGSFLLCAGSAQLTAVELWDRGASPVLVVGTVVAINLRFALYSAGVARWFATEPLRRRLLLAFPLVDQLFVLCSGRFDRGTDGPAERRSYYVAASTVLVGGWVVAQALALRFAGAVPEAEVLALAAPLVFAGLLTTSVRDRAGLVAAVGGALAAVLAVPVPGHLAVLVGVVVGTTAAGLVDRRAS